MLGDFITGFLVICLGYAYPALECYKTVEKNRVEIEELRFWCQYWIILALVTVFEKIGEIFISWVPMYGEAKLAIIIYLWYPKTKGTSYVYESMLRPYFSRHETDIDRKILELRARAWDLAIFYWENCTKVGESTFFQVLQFLAAQSTRATQNSGNEEEADKHSPSAPPKLKETTSFFGRSKKQQQQQQPGKQRPPIAPPSPFSTMNRSVTQPTQADTIQIQVQPDSQTEHIDVSRPGSVTEPPPAATPETEINEKLHTARLRLRRSRPH